MGPGWDSLVGDQADIQMKFFRLEVKLWFVRRLWSWGTTTSLMAREEEEEEEEAVQEAGLAGTAGGSSASSLRSRNPHFDDLSRTCVQWLPSVPAPFAGPGHT